MRNCDAKVQEAKANWKARVFIDSGERQGKFARRTARAVVAQVREAVGGYAKLAGMDGVESAEVRARLYKLVSDRLAEESGTYGLVHDVLNGRAS